MQKIDEARLERISSTDFPTSPGLWTLPDDIAAVQATATWLAPLVPTLVDAVYEKLFQYDATKLALFPANPVSKAMLRPIWPTLITITR